MVNIINIWTDGSCDNNPRNANHGLGGWAFIAYLDGELIEEDLGFHQKSSSSTMEMEAIIKALEFCIKTRFKKVTINIHSDSAMVVNCFNDKWYFKWEENNYFTVKNSGLWKHMILSYRKLKKSNKVNFVKVKGHSGIEENERVDFLAGEARKFLIDKINPKCKKTQNN